MSVGILIGPDALCFLNFVMIDEISSPSTGSNDNEFGTDAWRYLEKFPSPVYLRSSSIESAMVEK